MTRRICPAPAPGGRSASGRYTEIRKYQARGSRAGTLHITKSDLLEALRECPPARRGSGKPSVTGCSEGKALPLYPNQNHRIVSDLGQMHTNQSYAARKNGRGRLRILRSCLWVVRNFPAGNNRLSVFKCDRRSGLGVEMHEGLRCLRTVERKSR